MTFSGDVTEGFYNYLDNEKYYKTHGKYADDIIDMELVPDAPPNVAFKGADCREKREINE